MLASAPVTAMVAVSNLGRARLFYEEKLGLKPNSNSISEFGVMYDCGNGTTLYIYPSPEGSDLIIHPASFAVENIEEMRNSLTNKGVEFVKIEPGGSKLDEKGFTILGNQKLAFFKDADGKVLALLQLVKSPE